MSERLEKAWGAHLITARTVHNALVDEGVVDPSRLRHTIAARKEDAKRLTMPIADGGQGLSQRQAAKVLGVHHSTVQADLAGEPPKSGGKTAAEKPILTIVPPRETFETIVIDPPWPMTKIKRDVRPNQAEFVRWWKETVRPQGNHGLNAQVGALSFTDAESLTGISTQQASEWERLSDVPDNRKRIGHDLRE